MKVIIHQALKQLLSKPRKSENISDEEITRYVKDHKFYNRQKMQMEVLIENIKEKLKQKKNETHIKLKLDQLGLYFKKQSNKSMFQIYEIVLKHINGVTYRQISNKTKLQIVNISHYCCRLKKMNFVKLKHQKSEKVVYPKHASIFQVEQEQEKKEKQFNLSNTFFFQELPILDNIWVNVSSVDSFHNNGITNEEIKDKVGRPSEVKLMMKMVQNANKIFQFNKQMISEGKVFENKYKNFPERLKNQISATRDQVDLEILDENVFKWLKQKFPYIKGQNFLFTFINDEIKSYHSVSGIKSVNKRTCTPIKLARYITILNSLNNGWPQNHNDLKKLIIEQEKIMHNGIIHKRSIIGILEGLLQKGILRREQDRYYPEWQPVGEEIIVKIQAEQMIQNKPRKKVHLSSIKNDNIQKIYGIKMTKKDYEKELKIKYLFSQLQSIYASKMKKAFKRIMFPRRSKIVLKQYEPQTNIVFALEDSKSVLPNFSSTNFVDFIQEIDYLVQKNGKKEQQLNINSEVTKIFRRYPSRSQEHLKAKFGNSWKDKVQDLLEKDILREENQELMMNQHSHRYLI